MPVIPVIHRDAQVRDQVRRGVRGSSARVLNCRGWDRLHRLAMEVLVDAVVVEIRREHRERIREWVGVFPTVPVFGFGAVRPDDGASVLGFLDAGAVDVVARNIDDAAAGDLVAARTVASRLRRELADAPDLLKMTEPIQRRVWQVALDRVDQGLRTATIADVLGVSREHVSREFAAGGAPNLKRVIDLAKLVVAAAMLANPGYPVRAVTRILGYATPSHLATCADRIAGVPPGELAELGPRGILNRFRRGRMRSRL